MLERGSMAPDFSLISDRGHSVSLSQFRGRKIVLYFYPKDNTPGCTTEACQFRDAYDRFIAAGAVIIGISPDTEKSHENFRNKYGLPFILAADPEKKVLQQYNALKEKKMYGRTYMGVQRSTFIIDENGKILEIFPQVKPDGHAQEILEVLNSQD
ncbi:MAG: thioredoxin-dependent thiol peroxidase [Spirochaetia bacterium]|nr:thioredoxin-dependent thiol peroxidase [Spirochaetia bacterium]